MLEAEYVIVAEVPSVEGKDSSLEASGHKHATFCKAIKIYHLHVQRATDTSDPALDVTALTHYGGVPYEALYSGVFMHESVLQMYMCMFEADVGLALGAQTRAANEALLATKIAAGFTSGVSLHPSSFFKTQRESSFLCLT
jgi:hypothetical protein